MPKKQWILLAVALVLAAVYVCFFTGWFQHREIHISSTSRASLAFYNTREEIDALGKGIESAKEVFQ